MPIPIQFRQARLIIDGVSYELAVGHVMQTEMAERDGVRGYAGTVGFTRGRISRRVTIEAEVLPEAPREEAWSQFGALLTDQQLRDRVMNTMMPATGVALDQLAAIYGVSREPVFALPASASAKLIAPAEAPHQPRAPEPRSRWLRLMDDREIC